MNEIASIELAESDEARWRIVRARDRRFDGAFVFGVQTTGVYCRPSCPARAAKRENVRFYPSCADAEEAGLRACKRCRPGEASREEQAVLRALAILRDTEPRSLADLAVEVGYSPSHFQRLFKRSVGLSPASFVRALKLERAGRALSEGARVTDAVYDAGYSAPSRFYEASRGKLGMTPSAWAAGGRGVTIHWSVVPTSLGPMLVAATGKGVCRLSFNEDEAQLRARFPHAELIEGGGAFSQLLAQVIEAVEQPGDSRHIPLDVQGTAFQEAVWRALQRIPPGETRSYAEIAAAVGRPGAVRAAGSANGANNVAVLIPCHRVIRSDGTLGGYAYGLAVKRELLRREQGCD